MGYRRDECRGFVRRPAGRRLLGNPRRRWKVILKWIFRNSDEES
jgi:hypothetical protein